MSTLTYVTQYKQAHSVRAGDMLRHHALNGLAWLHPLTGAPTASRPRVQFLYLPHLFEDETEGFRDLRGS